MFKRSNNVACLVGDGFNDGGIVGGGIQHHEGVVVFDGVAFIDGFGEASKLAVFVKAGGFADIDGGELRVDWVFGHEDDILRGELLVEGLDYCRDALLGQAGGFYLHIVNMDVQVAVVVAGQFAIEVEIDNLRRQYRKGGGNGLDAAVDDS